MAETAAIVLVLVAASASLIGFTLRLLRRRSLRRAMWVRASREIPTWSVLDRQARADAYTRKRRWWNRHR